MRQGWLGGQSPETRMQLQGAVVDVVVTMLDLISTADGNSRLLHWSGLPCVPRYTHVSSCGRLDKRV